MTEQEILNLFYVLILPALGIIITRLLTAREKLHQFRNLIDIVDDYAINPKMTEEQFQTAWSNVKILIGKKTVK